MNWEKEYVSILILVLLILIIDRLLSRHKLPINDYLFKMKGKKLGETF